jgi:hypothetical protein
VGRHRASIMLIQRTAGRLKLSAIHAGGVPAGPTTAAGINAASASKPTHATGVPSGSPTIHMQSEDEGPPHWRGLMLPGHAPTYSHKLASDPQVPPSQSCGSRTPAMLAPTAPLCTVLVYTGGCSRRCRCGRPTACKEALDGPTHAGEGGKRRWHWGRYASELAWRAPRSDMQG